MPVNEKQGSRLVCIRCTDAGLVGRKGLFTHSVQGCLTSRGLSRRCPRPSSRTARSRGVTPPSTPESFTPPSAACPRVADCCVATSADSIPIDVEGCSRGAALKAPMNVDCVITVGGRCIVAAEALKSARLHCHPGLTRRADSAQASMDSCDDDISARRGRVLASMCSAHAGGTRSTGAATAAARSTPSVASGTFSCKCTERGGRGSETPICCFFCCWATRRGGCGVQEAPSAARAHSACAVSAALKAGARRSVARSHSCSQPRSSGWNAAAAAADGRDAVLPSRRCSS